ncbi:fimbrial biogenesis chaperone [Chitinophaga caseinilytica]|uniref:fimbrial biogenesis chaperone n=1 Tax=Chitinophaga caseinilytica TaxID=2267521 RepID=UPI003C2D3834
MRLFFAGLFSCICMLPAALRAQGNLLITPMRIVFDGKKKVQEVNLANTGDDTARYLISLIEIRMKDNGTFEQITSADTGQRFASPFIRFFPRSVVLPPREAQVVKLQLYNTSELDNGEYRSHLYLRAEPNQPALGEPEDPPADPEGISIKLTPVFGISIPVIVRNGDQHADVSIDSLGVIGKGDTAKLKVTFKRSGNISVYGDIRVEHISPDGKRSSAGLVKGVAVYTPNERRSILLPLKKGPDYTKGRLEISYGPEETTDPPLARAALPLR